MDLFDVDAIERAEAELDSFIEKRSRSQEEATRTEARYAESVLRLVGRRRVDLGGR